MPDTQSDAGTQPPAKRAPYGPGPLMIFGIALLVVAAFCFKDVVYPAEAVTGWRQQGKDWYITMNWAVMIVAVIGAAYSFILAAKRSGKAAAGQQDGGKT